MRVFKPRIHYHQIGFGDEVDDGTVSLGLQVLRKPSTILPISGHFCKNNIGVISSPPQSPLLSMLRLALCFRLQHVAASAATGRVSSKLI